MTPEFGAAVAGPIEDVVAARINGDYEAQSRGLWRTSEPRR